MRALLDSNGVDPILDLPGALEAVEAAVRDGRLQLLIPVTAIDELGDTRDRVRRDRLLSAATRAETVPEGAFVIGRARVGMARLGDADLFEQLKAGNEAHTEDALIIMSALYENAVLVTNERRLPNKAAKANVPTMKTAELLERIGYEARAEIS